MELLGWLCCGTSLTTTLAAWRRWPGAAVFGWIQNILWFAWAMGMGLYPLLVVTLAYAVVNFRSTFGLGPDVEPERE